MNDIARIVLVGIGAIGAPYARCFLRNRGDLAVSALVPAGKAASYSDNPVTVNGEPLPIAIEYGDDAAEPADLAIVAVKRKDLGCAIEVLRPRVGDGTQIVSLLNGIDSEELLAAVFGWEHVLYSTCVGMDSNRAGHAVVLNALGAIHFGEAMNEAPFTPRVETLAGLFESARIPYRIPGDMLHELWWKLMVNVGMNQVSAVYRLPYGPFREDGKAMSRMRAAQEEVVDVARASGIILTEGDRKAWEDQLATLSHEGKSSMLQDVLAGRKTEVDSFGGMIIELGHRLGVATPVNEALVAEIASMEHPRLPGDPASPH